MSAPHQCQSRPGEEACFVCGAVPVWPWLRKQRMHEVETVEYGPDPENAVEECKTCHVEWPCPAIKAINREAAKAKKKRKAKT